MSVCLARLLATSETLADSPLCDEICYEGSIRQHPGMGNAASLGASTPVKGNLAIGTRIDQLPIMDRKARVNLLRKFARFVQHHPPLAATAFKPALIAVVEQLAGASVRLLQDMAIIKPPRRGR